MLKSVCRTGKILITIFLLIIISCSKDDPASNQEKALDYFPYKVGNNWTYLIEDISKTGEIIPRSKEKWKVNPDRFIDISEITTNGEMPLGYKVIYPYSSDSINDIMGTYISVDYIDLPVDTFVLVASDNYDFLRERWIKGGKVQLDTNFGKRECICSKTIFYYDDPVITFEYFCKDIGIYLIDYGDKDGFISGRKTILEYELF